MNVKLKFSRETQIFVGLVLVYLLLTFILPASHATKSTYNLTDMQYKYLLFIVRLPIVALWAVAFYSYRWLTRYARQINSSDEGPEYAEIAKGIGWIAWGFPVPALLSVFLNAIANDHRGFLAAALIISGYAYVVVPLVAFSYISRSSHILSQNAKVQLSTKHVRTLILSLVLFSVLFCILINHQLHSANLSDSFNSFYLPNWLVWLTLVIPYLYAAFVGIFSALELMLIARRTPGIIYKQALQLLAGGIVLIIAMLVALQYVRSIIPRTGHLVIGSTLILTYIIYGVGAIGALLIAAGAKRLKRIEDA